MPSKTPRQELIDSYILSTMARDVISPPETLEESINNFQQTLDFISLIENTRYLRERPHVPKQGNIDLAWDFASDPDHHHRFLNMLRISPTVFNNLLSLIENHPIFKSENNRGQAAVELQLAVTLYRMGRYGNGASVEDVARMAGCSEEEKEVEKAYMDNHLGFKGLWREGWVMYDGTIVVLFRKPGQNGDAYYTRKSNYGLNLQVGNVPSNL
ncbi:hypothetical protein HYPSUDRAFT_122605, partial [Hypholoma sublateritium FD-334 SS-4]